MTLLIIDFLRNHFDVHVLLPREGPLSEELDKRGISYAFIGDQTLPIGYKSVRATLKYLSISLKGILSVMNSTQRYKPDLIYVPGPAALPWGAVVGQVMGVPVVWHLHHIFVDKKTRVLLNFFALFKSVKKIIAVSDCVGNQVSFSPAISKRVTIYNPVEASNYEGGNRNLVEEEIGLVKGNALWVGHIGILQPSKRQDFVIRVVKELLNRGLDVHGILVGSARAQHEGYAIELADLVESTSLTDRIHFLGHRDDICNVLASVDILVIPSLEGFPLVGLEAFAAGVPVVAYAEGGAGEIVRVSSAGMVYDQYDNELLAADAILDVLIEDHYKILVVNGRDFVQRSSCQEYERSITKMLSSIAQAVR